MGGWKTGPGSRFEARVEFTVASIGQRSATTQLFPSLAVLRLARCGGERRSARSYSTQKRWLERNAWWLDRWGNRPNRIRGQKKGLP